MRQCCLSAMGVAQRYSRVSRYTNLCLLFEIIQVVSCLCVSVFTQNVDVAMAPSMGNGEAGATPQVPISIFTVVTV